MRRKAVLVASLTACLALAPGIAQADPVASAARPHYTPGADGAGDPYFPLDGNGGYDVQHYLLDLKYDPATDTLSGTAAITAKATQDLSSFNLDFEGLTVRSVTVNGRAATWSRTEHELTVTPSRGLNNRSYFFAVVQYDGVPIGLEGAGFIHTDDGALVVGQPHAATAWFPANDHPIDKAALAVNITVPSGLQAVSNGTLLRTRSRPGWDTFTWTAWEPMAPYLAMLAIGEFDVSEYEADGLRFWDAIDPDLFNVPELPRTGDQFAYSQVANFGYKRLTHTVTVPADGAELSFWIKRNTEPNWDYTFVEAHTVGADDWTTLPDLNGHTTQGTGRVCPFWLGLHPFLEHYQTDNGDGTCSPSGTSGDWWAVSGVSADYEEWAVDLADYAGSTVEVSISYASDDTVQGRGNVVDDVTVSTGEGTTSFEDDGDTLDGWTVPGAPEGSEPNANDWIAATTDIAPPTFGSIAEASFARQPEILSFLADYFGPYPFSAAGGIVDDVDGLGFALENQTRPIYSKGFFDDTISGDAVIVHEYAHQWYGDSLAIDRWQHIWLNEGFATYAEWLWSEHEGLGTVQENFDFFYSRPASSPFWTVLTGDPGPDNVFHPTVYDRGAMTLHQLRLTIGDDVFFKLVPRWARLNRNGNVNTDQFIALAERMSGQQLDDLFQTWLFTPSKPVLPAAADADVAVASADAEWDVSSAPPIARAQIDRHAAEDKLG